MIKLSTDKSVNLHPMVKKIYAESISNDELKELAMEAFSGEIVVVDDPKGLPAAYDYLQRHKILGFDTETRPSFTPGIYNKVSLLQLSSEKRAFLFRLNQIGMPDCLMALLSSTEITKVGVAVNDDVRLLRALRRFTPQGFIDLQHIAPHYGIMDKSLRKLAAITLQIRISKAQRLSNWEAQKLTPAQQLYAATDAWVGWAIYDDLLASGSDK